MVAAGKVLKLKVVGSITNISKFKEIPASTFVAGFDQYNIYIAVKLTT